MIIIVDNLGFEKVTLKGVTDYYVLSELHLIQRKASQHNIELDSHSKIDYVKTLLLTDKY